MKPSSFEYLYKLLIRNSKILKTKAQHLVLVYQLIKLCELKNVFKTNNNEEKKSIKKLCSKTGAKKDDFSRRICPISTLNHVRTHYGMRSQFGCQL